MREDENGLGIFTRISALGRSVRSAKAFFSPHHPLGPLLVCSILLIAVYVWFSRAETAPGNDFAPCGRCRVEVVRSGQPPLVRSFSVPPRLSEIVPVSGQEGEHSLPCGSRILIVSDEPYRFRVGNMSGEHLLLFSEKVELNTATYRDLTAVPGIGPRLARRILEWRRVNGGYQRLEDLILIRGIGPYTLSRLEEYLIIRAE